MAEWSRLAKTTISDYMKGVEDELVAKRKLLKMLKSNGLIKYNCTGTSFTWQVPYRIANLEVNNGETAITPVRQDRFQQPTLTYVGYKMTDAMTERERLMNASGPSQLVGYFSQMAKRLSSDVTQRFGEELYIDSSATGNSSRLTGLESMFATNGTVTISSGAQRSANAADVVGYPNDTYAGLSTVLGNYSGTWTSQSDITSTWPAGRGELGYDFYSPVIVCYNSTAWGGASANWANNCVTASRYLITHMNRYESENGNLNMLFIDRDLKRQFEDKQDAKERVLIEKNNGARAFGFNETIVLDGCEIDTEFGIPAGIGYGVNIKDMELRSMYDVLFKPNGPTYEELNQVYHVIVRFMGQMKFRSPRHFGKLMTIAS